MRFKELICFVFILIGCSVLGQHSEVGVTLGTSYYLGEINPSIHLLNEVRPSVGVFYRKNNNKRYSLRGGVNYAGISASDNFTSTAIGEYRNLSFSANLFEGYGILEFNFIPYQINNYTTSPFTPYVFIGVAMFYADISTENQLKSLVKDEVAEDVTAPSIPFGLGIKFNFVENFGLGIEWGLRKTFTDEVDGLQSVYFNDYQLSNTQNNDWYSIVGITLNYKFLTKRDNCPGVIN